MKGFCILGALFFVTNISGAKWRKFNILNNFMIIS